MVSNFKYILIYLCIYKQNHPKYKTLEIYDMIYGVYVMTFQSDEALIPDY